MRSRSRVKARSSTRSTSTARVKVLSTGAIDADANLDWDFKELKLQGDGRGWLENGLFDLEGTAKFTLVKLSAAGDVVVSSRRASPPAITGSGLISAPATGGASTGC